MAGSETFRISSEQIVMPSCERRQHQRGVLHRVQGGLGRPRAALGERLDLRAARRDDGELRADEEGVEREQNDEPCDSRPVAHERSPPSAAVGSSSGIGVCVKRTRSTRRPSMRCTSRVPSSMSSVSPTAGMRSEHAHDVPADRVVDVSFGNADAGAVAHLVGAQLARERDQSSARTMPARRRSCSSSTSPTISSTRSSSVTTPAVPPYSSTTIAIW